MRVTFPRLPDHQRAYALVERDDGVVYQLYGGMAGPRLPHDIMHLVVERELRIRDGIWGGIAAGIVFDSMRHVSGRRPPHRPPQPRPNSSAARAVSCDAASGLVGARWARCAPNCSCRRERRVSSAAALDDDLTPDGDQAGA